MMCNCIWIELVEFGNEGNDFIYDGQLCEWERKMDLFNSLNFPKDTMFEIE